MSSLNHYIYDLKGLLRNHNLVDEDLLTDRQVEFWIKTQRELWIKRRDKALIGNDNSITQTLITPVISIDRSYKPDLVPAEYRILRSEDQLPKAISFDSWDGIVSTGSIDMVGKRFNHCSMEEAINSGWGRFNRSQIFTFTYDSYLFLISQSYDNYWKLISQASVKGIWSDPREVGNFIHIDGDPCWTPDDEYPLSLDLWEFMKDMIYKGNIDPLLKVPVDQSNDDNQAKTDTP